MRADLGLGIGLTFDNVMAACERRLAGDPTMAMVDYVNLGVRFDDVAPAGLANRLRECGWPVVIHAVDINLSGALVPDEIKRLGEVGASLDPVWYEEDLGIWVWDRLSLGLHHMPPLLTEDGALRSAENVRTCRELLGRPFNVENPPVHYAEGDLDMWAYLAIVAEAADCGIILDSGHMMGFHINTDSQMIEVRGSPMWIDMHPAPLPPGQLDWVRTALDRVGDGVTVCLEQDGASERVAHESLATVREMIGVRR
jgi:uncharacterized protein (UPF0276 family)